MAARRPQSLVRYGRNHARSPCRATDSSGNAIILFWVDPETPEKGKPGGYLYEVLDLELAKVPLDLAAPVRNTPPTRKYLGVDRTLKGEASISFPLAWISAKEFSTRLIEQTISYGDKGKISGRVSTGVYNLKTQLIEQEASIPVEFTAMAQILGITGEGQPDDKFKDYPGRARASEKAPGPAKFRL